MAILNATFFHFEWDNYQGGSGLPKDLTQIFECPDDLPVSDVRDFAINKLNEKNFVDSLHEQKFSGRGLIAVEIW